MASLDLALTFAIASLLVELTPGPNMAWLALLAATEGRRRGLAAVAGVATGLALMGAAAAFGLAALVQAQPLVYLALRWAGLAYLLWLAFRAWVGADREEGGPMGLSAWRYFRQGVITNVLNPKAAVFFVTVVPSFLPSDASLMQSLEFSAIYVAVATAVHAAIVVAAGAAHGALTNPSRVNFARKTMALALVGVAIWLFLKS